MATARLTNRTIDALRPKADEQYVCWDAEVHGLGVRVSPAGTKTFLLKYRLHSGRGRWKTLGRVGDLPLKKARQLAKDDIGIVARGGDPLSEKDAARDAVTIATVAERFLKEHVEARRKPATLRTYKQVIDQHIVRVLGSVPIADLTTADALRLHQRLAATKFQANRALAVLSKMVAWAASAKLRQPGPNPCHGIEKFPEAKRRRYLSEGEYAKVGRALRASKMAPGPKAAIELLLLTGARPQEIATLKWSFIDLRGAALNLPDSKTGAKVIHLSPPAVRLLKRWPRFSGDYVFPGNGRRHKDAEHLHASTITHAWAELREDAGLNDVRLYDACRHSFASVAVSQHGLSLVEVGAQLGHSQVQTTARYAHLHSDVAKKNAADIGGSIAAALRKRVRKS
jgi:integrase